MIAAAVAVELYRCAPVSRRADAVFAALTDAALKDGIAIRATERYHGHVPWLLLWGPGEPSRRDVIARHVAAGGRVIATDLAYWDRERKVRVSFDAPHPQRDVMRVAYSSERFLADRVSVTQGAWNPKGPIVVAGIGPKASLQYGDAVTAWERAVIAAAKQAGRAVIYKPKKHESHIPAMVTRIAPVGESIDRTLHGAAALLTWHSNCAVDAIRLGVPACCQDGAAAAVVSSDYRHMLDDPQPLDVATRDQFLANLAHFQWAPAHGEARQAWRFIVERLSC